MNELEQLKLKRAQQRAELMDVELSTRFIALDPKGYFLISLDVSAGEIVVEHFTNDIDEDGRAVDPETGKILDCSGETRRFPTSTYRGVTAKELGIQLTEGNGPYSLSQLDHALYLGRELQRAETCLLNGVSYVQD